MSSLLITLGGTVAAAAVTWFFCMRPMLRKGGAADASCCAVPAHGIEDEIRAAKEDLQRLQQADATQPGLANTSGARVHGN